MNCYQTRMTNINISVIYIYCIMFFEDFILIRYYLNLGQDGGGGRYLTISNVVL